MSRKIKASEIEQLAHKIKAGTATAGERAAFDEWYQEQLEKQTIIPESFAPDSEALGKRMLTNILRGVEDERQPTFFIRHWRKIAVAASILIACSAGGIFFMHHTQQPILARTQEPIIRPGHGQATLTLANGKQIVLTKGISGIIAKQGQTSITALSNQLVYNSADHQQQVSYNTLTTARGEQSPYPVVLSDGTKVLLNAASSITFPTAFTGTERRIMLTGEAYFEVAHREQQPFRVQTANELVEDIGTHFDINAYPDEPRCVTTLTEGMARVSHDQQNMVIQAGFAATWANGSLKRHATDPDAATAWMDGRFVFDDEPLASIMRKIARWYDVDVVYTGIDSSKPFWGSMSRYDHVSRVLKNLELTGGVHFKIEGRRITVTK